MLLSVLFGDEDLSKELMIVVFLVVIDLFVVVAAVIVAIPTVCVEDIGTWHGSAIIAYDAQDDDDGLMLVMIR